ncbi:MULTISPECIES: hypothetical protein [unclassified Sphingopyxis]|uniref:hypothetical protein n=1 Tax=unclassified Sphingopyxis TaxID=2614943 RepID=UPI00072FCB11|nr:MULTISPECIES: hypothetical protein [unclassified Sphingopyxis]MBD3731093.1 hypothetical protein [Sphingopyxis sp.]KTE28057.1 hypothetical protein ATE61_01690 [Sphingopyxis sp. H057]KTE55563.1 hypothetical protein ATE64_01225 [Sphingopyxis sp. H073]KTE57553.1 hypothetical protein ATE69_01690 [Sphingopyxis sp. H071]KTE58000.1 hypothetical protein ATE66_17110 [Sphingopyxis sp. H107]
MTLIELASLFEERKSWLVTASDLGKDALHIYFGLALFMLVRLAWRWRGGWVAAWLAVLVMACGGEWLDMTAEFSNAAIQPDAAHWHDIWNTMFWPTVLLLVGRWLQPVAQPRADVSGEDAERRLEQA